MPENPDQKIQSLFEIKRPYLSVTNHFLISCFNQRDGVVMIFIIVSFLLSSVFLNISLPSCFFIFILQEILYLCLFIQNFLA